MLASSLALHILLATLIQTTKAEDPQPNPDGPKLMVTVSVDWEGHMVDEQNLTAIQKLRDDFPSVPLTHLLNPTYLVREAESSQEVRDEIVKDIRSVIRDGDELGLHIHCWRSLVEGAGIEYRSEPTFFGDRFPPSNFRGNSGHEVELDAYTLEEIRTILRFSAKTLGDYGFGLSKSFRCPAWRATPKVLEAVRAEGFLVDTSATDPTWHREELNQLPLHARLKDLWSDITPLTQPYVIETKAGDLLEMPDTGALADYLTGEEMIVHLREALAAHDGTGVRFAHIGFHFETAARFLPRISKCLEEWANHPELLFVTLEDAAECYREQAKGDKNKPNEKRRRP